MYSGCLDSMPLAPRSFRERKRSKVISSADTAEGKTAASKTEYWAEWLSLDGSLAVTDSPKHDGTFVLTLTFFYLIYVGMNLKYIETPCSNSYCTNVAKGIS